MSLYIGLISGTSVDAIDAALVDLGGTRPVVVSTYAHAIPTELRRELLCAADRDRLHQVLRLDVRMGHLFSEAALALLDAAGCSGAAISAIGSHGQTVSHQPSGDFPYTLQIGDPNIIVERTGITTVADFRRRDIAAGGQGAPLVPAYHYALFQSRERARAVVNIGGIANVTVLPSDPDAPVLGFDTGPGNGLLDTWANRHLGVALDREAAWAQEGEPIPALLSEFLADAFFAAAPPKSTGKEDFNLAWIQGCIERMKPEPGARDVQRTLCELTVVTIADAIAQHASDTDEIFVCGGGVNNPLLMRGLQARLKPRRVVPSAERGIDPDFVEACAFAWLAKQTLDGRAASLPSVTGAGRPVVLGAIYPAG